MSKSKYGKSTLSGLVESDSDDARFVDESTIPTPDSGLENMEPKKGRGRVKAGLGKVTKAKAAGEKKVAPVKRSSRKALADKTNAQKAGSDTEEVEDFDAPEDTTINALLTGDELDESMVSVTQKKSRATKPRANSKTQKAVDAAARPTAGARTKTVTKKAAPAKRQQTLDLKPLAEVIQETQASDMNIDDGGDEELEEPTPKPEIRPLKRARSQSQSRQVPAARRRAGSASDSERNDPATRRKLGEITRKFDKLELKYNNLHEIGIKQAEQNVERAIEQFEENKKGKVIISIFGCNTKSL
jgi:hypothetical protein